MSKSRHTGVQMIAALKQVEAGRRAEDVAARQRRSLFSPVVSGGFPEITSRKKLAIL